MTIDTTIFHADERSIPLEKTIDEERTQQRGETYPLIPIEDLSQTPLTQVIFKGNTPHIRKQLVLISQIIYL